MRVVAVKQFTDKQGKSHQANETFEVNDQEAQELIKNGQAREAGGQSPGSER